MAGNRPKIEFKIGHPVAGKPKWADYYEGKGGKTDAEALACAEATRANIQLTQLPGRKIRVAKRSLDQGSLYQDETRKSRIHSIREARLKRWPLTN